MPEADGTVEAAMRVLLAERYRTVRPFLALLGGASMLRAAAGGGRVLAAVRSLPELAVRRLKAKPLLPADVDASVVPPMWARAVYRNPALPDGVVDRDAYVLCVLEQLHSSTFDPAGARHGPLVRPTGPGSCVKCQPQIVARPARDPRPGPFRR